MNAETAMEKSSTLRAMPDHLIRKVFDAWMECLIYFHTINSRRTETHTTCGQSCMNQGWPSCELIENNERARVCILEW